ncbi:spore coat protein YlbD [Halalkalibacillus halophilus]|uniref:spore coat protein YlbD n=1 Tax=Halalkalibacillus halophilus TaxID=392827 RepID=UPI000403618F|nr:spore coat protein YlbD [Halalkalibacillus halophilus]
MSESKLPAEIEEFKNYVLDHPQVMKDVQAQHTDWQRMFEQWRRDGEYHLSHQGTNNNTQDQFAWREMMDKLSSLDLDKVEKNIAQLTKTISHIQELTHQYKGNKQSSFRRPRGF